MAHHDGCILAIDLGTSGAKVALVTVHGEILGWSFVPVKVYLMPGGGAEQDPEEWWAAIGQAAKELLAREIVPREAVQAVCTSSMGEETVAVDKGGRCLMRSLNWMDSRGAAQIRKRMAGPIALDGADVFKLLRWVRLTGGCPSKSGKDPAGHILYIQQERPAIYAQTYKFLNSLDFVNLRLTGEYVATADSIMPAWVTDNRRIHAIDYSPVLLKTLGIEQDKLPTIVEGTTVIGQLRPAVASAWGLPSGVKVVAGSIDTCASAIGAGAVEDYQACLSLGTSSYLVAHVPFKKTDIVHNMASLPSAIPGRYLLMNNQSTAGGNLNFLRDKVLYHKDELLHEEQQPDVYKIFDAICARVPAGSRGLVYTPWLYGERTPVDDPYLRGGLHNLSLEHTREDMLRAVFEGVALNARWMLGPAERFINRAMDPLILAGGGASSAVWCGIYADVLNRTIRQVQDPIQVNARGAALIAATALKAISLADIPALTRYAGTYTPRPEYRALYDERFEIFKRLYRSNRGIYHRLNRGAGAAVPGEG